MPLFFVRKWHAGSDASGDDFIREEGTIVVRSASRELLAEEIAKADRTQIYANEFLRLELGDECLEEQEGTTFRKFLSSYPTALEKIE